MTSNFFDEQTEQSLIKAEIVTKYFDAWANVIVSTKKKYSREEKILYIDLFAGPGRYKDGSNSTPLKILEKAISNPKYCKNLYCIFNDKDGNNSKILESLINNFPGIEKLNYRPDIYNIEIGDDIAKVFENTKMLSTFFFVDPWGYKGLSLRLINSVLKDWGTDCIFFFNYNRINMGMRNSKVKEHIDALFGEDRANKIRAKIQNMKKEERELIIVEEICCALKDLGGKFTLPFRFKDKNGKRTSHHLIFVSKHFTGYGIMKDIMARESSSSNEGIPSFEYNPRDILNSDKLKQGLLFNLTKSLKDLKESLLEHYAGQTKKMKEIYEENSVDTPFIKKNYKEVLLELEADKVVEIEKHRKGTLADDKKITFL